MSSSVEEDKLCHESARRGVGIGGGDCNGTGAEPLLLEDAPGHKVVEAVGDVGEAVGDTLVVVASVGGIDAVAGIEVAEGAEGVVVVAEEFDEDVLERSGLGDGGEEGADPAVVGGEAAAGGHGGGVEAAEFAALAHPGNEGFVLGDGEGGVAAVGGIGEGLEELVVAADQSVGGLQELPEAAEVGEGGKLPGAQKFDVPTINAGVGEAGFGVAAMVELGVLFDGRFEVGAVLACGSAHPLLDGGGGDDGDAMFLGGLETEEKLLSDRGFVIGIHGIGATDHEDEVEIEAETFQAVAEFIEVAFVSAADNGDLDRVDGGPTEIHEFLELGNHQDLIIAIAGDASFLVRDKSTDPAGVGGNDSQFNIGLVDDVGHGF